MDKEFFGILSIAFTVVTYGPYMWSTVKGYTRPHIFSWFIWGLLQTIATAGQFAGHAGAGWWASAFSGACCLLIAVLSYKYGEKNITRFDVSILILALVALPLWYATDNPLSAIILVSFIDLLGYLPTARKAYYKPWEEMWFSYLISNIKHILSIFAMSTYSLTTVLYPVVLLSGNFALIALIFSRRRVQVKKS